MIRQTSIWAYNTIKANGLLSAKRWQAYDLLTKYGPATSSELFEHYKEIYKPSFRYNANIHSRLNELRERGVAKELGRKECAVSGHSVILWEVTDGLPIKMDKKPSPKELIRDLCDQLENTTPNLDLDPEWYERTNRLLKRCAKYRGSK